MRGVPSHSPLTGEVVEDEDKNNIYISSGNDLPSTLAYPDATLPRIYLRTLPPPNPPVADDVPWAPGEGFPSPQWAGNILQSDRGAITIAGELQAGDTVDLYVFEVDFNAVQYSGTFVPPTDDESDLRLGLCRRSGRANTSIFVYEAIVDPSNFDVFVGQLVFASKDGGDRDDLPGPLAGPDLEDLSRGSVGRLDPFLGPIEVPEGTYILAITNGDTEPTVLNEQFDVRLPANPFLRVTPIEKVARIQDVTFDGPPTEPILFDANSAVPFNLGDVTLFVTQPGGGMGTNLFTVDAFTGAAETIVGPLSGGFEVGDIAFANKYSTADPADLNDPTSTDNPLNDLYSPNNPRNLLDILFGLSLGDADDNSGNYLAINPGDATVTGVGEDNEITDDEIETYEVDDPAMPMGAVQTDEGVQFQAITFLNPQGDPIPYAIGHRAAISNILYTFDHGLTDTPGRALSDPGQDRPVDLALVDPPGTAQTQIVERGVLLTDADPQPGDNSALIVTAADLIRDGDQITLGDDTTVEFNIWPDALVTIDPLAGVFLRDGDQLSVDNISYEIETGLVLVVGDETGAFDIADGDTFTLTDNQRSPVTYTFEFDSGDGADSGIAVSFDDTTTLDELVVSMIAAINSAEGFAIQASSVGNRISLTHEASFETSSSSIRIEGAVSASAPRFIRIEETFSLDEVLAAFQRTLPDAVVQDNRISFIGAASADFSEFVARGIFEDLNADGTLVAGTVQVDFLPTDTDEVIADRVATALSDFGVDAEATGSVVVISPDVGFASAPPISRSSVKHLAGRSWAWPWLAAACWP